MAIAQRRPPAGLLHHSDRGVHYTNARYRKFMMENAIDASYSRLGNCWDNAITESFFHTLKTEEAHHANYLTREQARQSLFEYIEVW